MCAVDLGAQQQAMCAQGDKANEKKAQEALLTRAQANSKAQLGQYDPSIESEGAGEKLYEKGYKY